jgi:hypothetical protein
MPMAFFSSIGSTGRRGRDMATAVLDGRPVVVTAHSDSKVRVVIPRSMPTASPTFAPRSHDDK